MRPFNPKYCTVVTSGRPLHLSKQALLHAILVRLVAGCLHVPARGFPNMASSSRRSSFRSSFLIVFVLAMFGLLGMLVCQRISPATTPSSDSDVRDSLKQFTNVYETIEQNYATR